MNKKIKIGILGIGGVGGFIGAPLAQYYSNKENVEIIYICRGKTLETINNNGLLFTSQNGDIKVKPDLCSNNSSEIGQLDILLITTKSYSLKSVIKEYEDLIGKNTVLITLQNMVNSKEIIREVIPEKGIVLEGVIYVASNVHKPGVIQHVGGPGKVIIGGEDKENIQWVVDLFQAAGIDFSYSEDIKQVLWSKYLFVAPVAAITTAYNKTFGQLLEEKDLYDSLRMMMDEIKNLAEKLEIILPEIAVKNATAILKNFPYEAKSSMQRDFEEGKPIEKEFMMDYIIDESKRLGLEFPIYSQVNEKLMSLSN